MSPFKKRAVLGPAVIFASFVFMSPVAFAEESRPGGSIANPYATGSYPSTSAVGTAASKMLNPDISVNFLGFFRKSNINTGDLIGRTSDLHNGFTFQEAEIQFFADVDPYFRANALFSLAPSTQQNVSTDENGVPSGVSPQSGYSFEPEEVFFESISLPVVTLRGGKFFAAFGRHNTLHTHAFPFIDAPLINQDVLSGEGLNETGVSVSTLVPMPFFMEFTAQALSNNNELLYNSSNAGDVSGVAQLRNLWELSDELTLELTVYGTIGKDAADLTANAFGSDLIFKWRPAEGGRYHALVFANEYIQGYVPGGEFVIGPSGSQATGDRLGGLASWIQYQFAERWWIQARAELEGLVRAPDLPFRQKQSALLAFYPSEFSGFRIQYDHLTSTLQPTENAVTLQWNISIGAHPAHAY